jgi:hypothetical protein
VDASILSDARDVNVPLKFPRNSPGTTSRPTGARYWARVALRVGTYGLYFKSVLGLSPFAPGPRVEGAGQWCVLVVGLPGSLPVFFNHFWL